MELSPFKIQLGYFQVIAEPVSTCVHEILLFTPLQRPLFVTKLYIPPLPSSSPGYQFCTVEYFISALSNAINSKLFSLRNEIYERPGTNAEVTPIVNLLTEYGVNIKYDLILDNDFETEETLKECITLLMKLPKPVFFNTFSLQHFPDYALTKKAIEAGHITKEELGDWPAMMKRTTENWSFVPKLRKLKKLKTTRIQMLNNIIWMMCWNHVSDTTVKYAVFGNSLGSKIMFHYLNIKSVLVWSEFGIGGFSQ